MALHLHGQPDEFLLRACSEGNTKAFDVLFERYAKKLYHYAFKYLGDHAVAEEIMMDVMVYTWEKRKQIDPNIPFAPYVFKAIKHAVIKVLTRKPVTTVSLDEIMQTTLAGSYNADGRVHESELYAVYEETLDELSEQRKKVYTLSRHEQLSHAEIAKEMNLSLFTVKNHIKASLSHFKDHLKDYVDISTVFFFCMLS
ncbi:RNA polymerase sigma-70 factor (ECF subfamily) [Chitinophaga skermanii]|uniref:RNA polymerase sigma-70 factor (ECF subfamily) n=1 Tax=Chitinophaga skermanii TaxID=331697 RepID=A0A327QYP3_9BACT|nr:RNA polymerase sigma-70 factor [Chitinophaga skermanii]RAJ08742.1 RNA polymerase sigma-70 factor (ECF subfamily) [Chitinophaga skermanii]